MVSPGDASPGDGAAEPEADETERGEEVVAERVGERSLTVLAAPLNVMVLQALRDGPLRLAELRQETGLPAQTTLRGHLASLIELGLVEKQPTKQVPYSVETVLTPMGRDLVGVASRLRSWLERAPDGPIALDSGAAKGVIKAFVDGWGSSMTQCLASRPMSLTELDLDIANLSYPALERRLSSMRMAGLVEPRPGVGVATPYTVTDWARRGVTPLVAASRCEARHLGDEAARATQADVEATFILAMPLVELPASASGSCRLDVIDNGTAVPESGVTVIVEAGRVVSCTPGSDPDADASVSGSAETWLEAVGGGEPERLVLGGGEELAGRIVGGLHAALLDG